MPSFCVAADVCYVFTISATTLPWWKGLIIGSAIDVAKIVTQG